MKIDDTNLLEALKHTPPDPLDAEKRRVAKEHHEWLKQIDEPVVETTSVRQQEL